MRYLYAARQMGDYLVVAVNTDRSVKIIKGANRPIQSQDERAELLAALSFVDAVVSLRRRQSSEGNPGLVRMFWSKVEIGPRQDYRSGCVRKAGGVVKSLPFVAGYSTSAIIEKIRDKR